MIEKIKNLLKNIFPKKINKHELKNKLKQAEIALQKLYAKLEKLHPSNIAHDRIKAEINRLLIIQNRIQLEIVNDNLFKILYANLIILAVVFIVSFFAKPKFLLEINLNTALLIVIISTAGVIIHTIIKHFLSRHDREATRKRELAEAENSSSSAKKNLLEIQRIEKELH